MQGKIMFGIFVTMALVALINASGECATEKEKALARIVQIRLNGGSAAGVTVPDCEEDGGYAPKQCYGDRCRCVAGDGTILVEDYPNIENGEMSTAEETCLCAREQHEFGQTGMVGKMFKCNSYGSYESIQCTGSVCYCADSNGEQTGDETAPIYEQDSLSCDDE